MDPRQKRGCTSVPIGGPYVLKTGVSGMKNIHTGCYVRSLYPRLPTPASCASLPGNHPSADSLISPKSACPSLHRGSWWFLPEIDTYDYDRLSEFIRSFDNGTTIISTGRQGCHRETLYSEQRTELSRRLGKHLRQRLVPTAIIMTQTAADLHEATG